MYVLTSGCCSSVVFFLIFTGSVSSVLLNDDKIIYIFDPVNNAVAVKLGDTCYATKITASLSSSLSDEQKLKHFQIRMMETISQVQGQKTTLTIRDLLAMSGKIASKCYKATNLYQIYVNTTSSTLNISNAVYFFDSASNVIAVKLANACYFARISYYESMQLQNPQTLEEFETHMLELVSLYNGNHTALSILDLLPLSGNIASLCSTVTDIYEISDPNHLLGIPLSKNPRDCYDLNIDGVKTSGVFKVYPSGVTGGIEVYCDMATDGGGWLVFQKRFDGSVVFNEDWHAYKTGFGNIDGEFWLGNSPLNSIVSQGHYKLRIDMEDATSTKKYAVYDSFSIGDESTKFKLTLSGYHGDAGDDLTYHNQMPFSTSDEDNDQNSSSNCAMSLTSGWWYNSCMHCDLNGPYMKATNGDGIDWVSFSVSLKKAEMKIKPA